MPICEMSWFVDQINARQAAGKGGDQDGVRNAGVGDKTKLSK